MIGKRSRFVLLAALTTIRAFAFSSGFQTVGADDASWSKILGSIGIARAASDPAVVVAGPSASVDLDALASNHFVILEAHAPAALGFVTKSEQLSIRQICDTHAPKMQIIWEQAVNARVIDVPATYQIFATEKWKKAPVIAGKRTAHGAILWVATSPGASGFERYPYLLLALADLGFEPPLRAANLWAFFDSAYRIRADVDYLARRWRQSGVSALHVAAWHNIDPDPAQDDYLRQLIAACHRNAILVYAWLELPHVSEKFWADHPAWREKTAVGQDAQLDWRKLMNLQNSECHREAARLISSLLNKFDWDGVNLGELYFESLEGASNPARFTPMNDEVRAEFKAISGVDPKSLFDSKPDPKLLRKFLDFRSVVASRMQSDWLKELDRVKTGKPYLDVVVTHIDDRFDPAIRDELGADVARTLPAIRARRSTLLVEDPANLWALGPERYSKLAQKYRELVPDLANVAVDINVVDRYQDVYPTKKQTGIELYQLMHQASESFGRVAVYFENSLEKQDLPLLPASAVAATSAAHGPDEIDVDAKEPVRVAWRGAVEMDGRPWPVQNSQFVLVPAGKHRLSPGISSPSLTLPDFNGNLRSAIAAGQQISIAYDSRTRAIANLGSALSSIELDGAPLASGASGSVLLPAGQHVVTFASDTAPAKSASDAQRGLE